jgi:hypothetical protein
MEKLLDTLCSDWHFDIDNLEHIFIEVNGKEYKRLVYNRNGKAYIIFKNEKYYFDYAE